MAAIHRLDGIERHQSSALAMRTRSGVAARLAELRNERRSSAGLFFRSRSSALASHGKSRSLGRPSSPILYRGSAASPGADSLARTPVGDEGHSLWLRRSRAPGTRATESAREDHTSRRRLGWSDGGLRYDLSRPHRSSLFGNSKEIHHGTDRSLWH